MIRFDKTKIIISIIIIFLIIVVFKDFIDFNDSINDISGVELKEVNENALIKDVLKRGKQYGEKPKIIGDTDISSDIFALNFSGLSDTDTNEEILKLLSKSNLKTTFFVTGIEAVENSNFIKKLGLSGINIGSNTLSGKKQMEKLSSEELAKEFVKSSVIIEGLTNKKPDYLLLNNTVYTDELLRIAYESGYENIIYSNHILNYQSFKNYEQVLGYVKSLKKGTIINIKMDGVLDDTEFEPYFKEEPSIDKKYDKDIVKNEDLKIISEGDGLVNLVKWILQAIEEVDYKVDYAENLSSYEKDKYIEKPFKVEREINMDKEIYLPHDKNIVKEDIKQPSNIDNVLKDEYTRERLDILRKKNNGKTAKELYTIYTTERAVNFSFYGISNVDALTSTLNKLDELAIRVHFL